VIITALVEIKLKNDGTWELLALKNPEKEASKRIIEPKKGGVTRVSDHFNNRDRINEERIQNALGNDSPKHCRWIYSDGSECGKVNHNILTHPHHS
jgi:hypothetical protein